MNPGKICTPLLSTEKLVSVDDKKRGFYDRQIPITIKESFSSALDCNGNGLCFNYDFECPMCPSSKVTRDLRHSPKGRAGLMREWLRLVEAKGVDILALEKNIQNWSVKQVVDKVRNQFKKHEKEDFSHEVMEAMQGCLACKACASQCPIKVDVPDFRSRFLNLYHSRYFRPLKDHLVANVEIMTPVMAKVPKLVNGVLGSKVYDKISRATIGYIDTPILSVPTLNKRLIKHGFPTFDLEQLQRLTSSERKKSVLVVQDPFTSFYDAKVVEDFMLLIKALGFNPIMLPFKPNGKPQHVKGFLAKFAKTAKNTADFLNKVQQLNMPMVGMDASLALCYRDEYNQVLGTARGNFSVLLSHEWLVTIPDQQINVKLLSKPKTHQEVFKLFAHCTEKTAMAGSEKQWREIFQQFGLLLENVSVGCCGMAGTYGHEQVNFDNSKSLYNLSWQAKILANDADKILVTGYSCRSQIKRFSQLTTQHPVQALLQSIS
jgi:Fe-S oxidoreductase